MATSTPLPLHLPFLVDKTSELRSDRLPSRNRCDSSSLLTERATSPSSPICAHCVSTRRKEQKRRRRLSAFACIVPPGKIHRKSCKYEFENEPPEPREDIPEVCGSRSEPKPTPYTLRNTDEKQPTLARNYCRLSKSIQNTMQGDKAIFPGRQIFQITGS